MQAYWADLKLFFQRAGAYPNTRVVLHVEPDLWGYIEQKATSDDAATIEAKVGSTGVPSSPACRTTRPASPGYRPAAQPVRPNVLLGYHVSVWAPTSTSRSVTHPTIR